MYSLDGSSSGEVAHKKGLFCNTLEETENTPKETKNYVRSIDGSTVTMKAKNSSAKFSFRIEYL